MHRSTIPLQNRPMTRMSLFIVVAGTFASCQMPVKTTDRERPQSATPVVVSEEAQPIDANTAAGKPARAMPNIEKDPEKVADTGARGTSGVLIAYEFKGDLATVPAAGCRLRLENVRTNKHTFVALKADQMAVFKELDTGRYFATRLSCGAMRIWNLDNLFGPGFDVTEGRVSYVGKVIFEMAKRNLSGFRQASRNESRETLREIQDIVSSPIVSGFTLRPIDSEMLTGEGRESFDVFAKGTSEPDKTLSDLMSKLKRCGFNNSKEDPLRLGKLTYVAKYQGGTFAEMAEKKDNNSFSENFTTCVDNSLRTFRPPLTGELEVRVAF